MMKQPRAAKSHWLWWVLGVLLIAGLVLIFNEPLKNLTVQYMSRSSYNANLKKTAKKRGDFNFKHVKPLDIKTVTKASTATPPDTIARLAIPSIGLRLPVFYGLDNNNLARGAGTMKPKQVLGKGNYALAGHYMTNSGSLLFAPLKRIRKSAYIYLADHTKTYTYQVIAKRTIDEHQVAVINDVPGQNLLTLVTCDSATINTPKRFIVQAKLIKQPAVTKTTQKIITSPQTDHSHWLWLLLLGILVVVVILLILILYKQRHQKRHTN